MCCSSFLLAIEDAEVEEGSVGDDYSRESFFVEVEGVESLGRQVGRQQYGAVARKVTFWLSIRVPRLGM